MGMTYQRGQVWWIKYYRHGKPYRESTKSAKEADAKRLLKKREGEISEGKLPGVYLDRIRFEEIADDFLTDYKVNCRKSLIRVEAGIRLHLGPFFEHCRVSDITTSKIKNYISLRQKEGAANGTINREMASLKRMLHIAARSTPPKIGQVPYIPMLKENNVRKGFFEHDQFLALRDALPEYLKGFVTLGYKTGWRKSELGSLSWDRVDMREKVIRLEVGETKNDDARNYCMDDEIVEIMKGQLKMRRLGCDLVFHRDGNEIKEFRKSWKTTCKKTKIEGKLFHDLRRTAVRNMIRAGIPERVAMTISGHKTRSVFDRYNIVSNEDLKLASHQMETYLNTRTRR